MWRLTAEQDCILDDLRSDLEDPGGEETWGEALEYALNSAWDRLAKTQPEEVADR